MSASLRDLARPRYYARKSMEIVHFVRAPSSAPTQGLSATDKARETFAVMVIKFIAVAAVALIAGILQLAGILDLDQPNVSKERMQLLYSPLGLLLVGALILPLLEETAFRLSLRFRPIFLSLSLGMLGYYLVTKGVFQTRISDVTEQFGLRVGLALAVVGLAFALLRRPAIQTRLQTLWSIQFPYVFYTTSLAFAWIHIFNYQLTPVTLLLMPLLTLPQFIGGLFYGYIRIQFGFAYSYGFHSLSNALVIMASLLLPPGD